jgi:tRNA pseudouridine38-40 synthase
VPRYKIIIEYDGRGVNGWQRQKNPNTIQEKIEEAIYKFSRQEVVVHGSGRTDAGVHALAQVAHFDLAKHYDTHTIINAINFYLRSDNIGIKEAFLVDEKFHARFSAKCRHYKYMIINQEAPLVLERHRAWGIRTDLDVCAMQKAANLLIGNHDFTSFRAKSCQAKSAIKTMNFINITKSENVITVAIAAPSFLHHMVRNIVGTLVMVGKANFMPNQIPLMLAAKDRASAGITAPACGLYFVKVEY